MEICFWCNRIKTSDDSNGDPIFRDYDFCDLCSRAGEQGITFIQVTTEPNGNPEIREGLHPTGLWIVVTEENVKEVLTDLPILDKVLRTRQMFINMNDWEKLNLPQRS